MPSTCSPSSTGVPPTSYISATSQFLGWLDIVDFQDYYGITSNTQDATIWVQESINLAVAMHMALYFTPRPYVLSGIIVVPGACTLIGIDSGVNSFSQSETAPYLVTACGAATFVATDGSLEMLCVTGDDVVIENINFFTTASTGEGGRAIHLLDDKNVTISNVGIVGSDNGILIDSASNVSIEDVRFSPHPSTVVGRYGIKADGLSSLMSYGATGAAGGATLKNCTVDQTKYPYISPTGGGTPTLWTVDAFVIDNGYQGLSLDSCEAKGARYGFASQNTSGGLTGNVEDFRVSFCRAYNCTVGVALFDGQRAIVQESLVVLDESDTAPEGTPNYGIQVSGSYSSGPILLSSNVVFGNSSELVGVDLEGATAISMNGGAVQNCGVPLVGGEGTGTGLRINAPAAANYVVQGVVISNCTEAGVEILAGHQGNASLVGLNIAKNSIVGTGSSEIEPLTPTLAVGLQIQTPDSGASGTVIVEACVFNLNDVDIMNNAATYGASALHKLANNVTASGSGTLSPPSPTAGSTFNNTGFDSFVYAEGISGSATLTIGGVSVSGLGSVPGVFFLPNSGEIVISGSPTGWTWIPE